MDERREHRCVDRLDDLGVGSHPYECLVCGKRLSALDIEEATGRLSSLRDRLSG